MKKFLSIMLSIMMVLSFSVPSFAASITSTQSGSNTASADVKASYTPTAEVTATITGVSITVDSTEYSSTNTSSTAPAKITPTSTVVYTVTGTNLDKATGSTNVGFSEGKSASLNLSRWTVENNGTKATMTVAGSEYTTCNSAFQIMYTNDGQSWTETGIYIIYDSGLSEDDKAEITGVSITVDGTPYTTGTATVKPTSSITFTVTGKNLNNKTGANIVSVAPGVGSPLTVSWEINSEGTSATKTFDSSYYQDSTTAFEIKYTNDNRATFVSTGIYILYQAETTSVDITWGSMTFTYSDEQVSGADKGWTCEDGSNKVTVKNVGSEKINASVSFKKTNDDIASVNGTLSKTSATLANEESEVFALTLSGKPTTALSDITLGTVTITITKPEEESSATWKTVSTEDDLRSAIAAGGYIKLGESIEINRSITSTGNVTLDLNGKSLTAGSSMIQSVLMLTFHNGTIQDNVGGGKIERSTGVAPVNITGELTVKNISITNEGEGTAVELNDGAKVTLTNVTVKSGSLGVVVKTGCELTVNGGSITGTNYYAVSAATGSTVTITDGELSGGYCSVFLGGTATLKMTGGTVNNGSSYAILGDGSGKITIEGGNVNGKITNEGGSGFVKVTGGTFTVDPTSFVDADNYTVTNSDGKYTVAKKA